MIGGHLAAVLTPLPVLIPMLAAAITLLAGRKPRLQRGIAVLALSVVLVVSAVLVYLADRDGTIALQVGGWGPTEPGMGPLGITLVVDRLSALMLVVSSIVTALPSSAKHPLLGRTSLRGISLGCPNALTSQLQQR